MKFFMSSLTFNILSQKCSDERKFGIEIKFTVAIQENVKEWRKSLVWLSRKSMFVMKGFQMIH